MLTPEREQEHRAYVAARLGRDPWQAVGYLEEAWEEIDRLREALCSIPIDVRDERSNAIRDSVLPPS